MSGDCNGQGSSTDELELVKANELSDELMCECDEADDLEFDSEPGRGAPKGVRVRAGRRLAAGIRMKSAEVGLCITFSVILPGLGSKDSWAACGSGSGYSLNTADSSEVELLDEKVIYCLGS